MVINANELDVQRSYFACPFGVYRNAGETTCRYDCMYKNSFGQCTMIACANPKHNYVNHICPYCGDGNHVHSMYGISKLYAYKCTNCNHYLNESDFYVGKHERRPK